MFRGIKYGFLVLAAGLFLAGCQKKTVIPEGEPDPGEKVYTGCIPENPDHLPQMYLTLPQGMGVNDIVKEAWTDNCSVRILATVDGKESTVYSSEGTKIKGHGNSTWKTYPKKPFTLKLAQQANFVGTGKTKRWVLLANWMDRTLLRNDIAFEAARRTSLEWTPSGTFVDLYINGEYYGLYWLGEKVHVEGSHFTCDYFYSYDTSDKQEKDFASLEGHWKNAAATGGIPVQLKYPDRDNYSIAEFNSILLNAKTTLYGIEEAIQRGDSPSTVMDMNTLCDWYLIQEFTGNREARFPKSTFLYYKESKIYWGPVWDFDFGTFVPEHYDLPVKNTLYYYIFWTHPEFISHLKHRWSILKPEFLQLDSYIDKRANLIRESEPRNHEMWPCYPNPLSEKPSGLVNGDEKMTFDEAVTRLKQAIQERVSYMDMEINRL